MRASSPPIAVYKTPLKGMDAREVKPQDTPNLLFNIDLSNRGYYQARPGVKKVVALADRLSGTATILGLHSTRVDGQLYLIALYADDATGLVKVSIFNGLMAEIDATNYPATLRGEPLNKRVRYSFVNAGRFVYFCNGYGQFWELEIKDVADIQHRVVDFEVGGRSSIYSYLSGKNISPSAMHYFFKQLVICGFKTSKTIKLSAPSEIVDTNKPWPPSEVLKNQRSEFNLDEGCIFVAEPGLWRSYPIEDPGGFYWSYDDDVIATAGIGTNLIVFCQKTIQVILGHGGTAPKITRLADVTLVGPHAIAYYGDTVFFVALDGCYVTNGQTVQKISYEMDPLWLGTDEPETTRYLEQQIQKTAYPFHINKLALKNTFCINDRARQQVMVVLPANDSPVCNMVWVYNYADLQEKIGIGKWSIWAGAEEPTFTGTSLGPSPIGKPSSPTQSNSTSDLFHWNCATSDIFDGVQSIYAGTNDGKILQFGVTKEDYVRYPTFDRDGDPDVTAVIVPFPASISLGRVGRADSDGRIICTDIAVRRKQLSKNVADSSSSTKLLAIVRSEGEGLKHFDATETDVEFSDAILNAQQGVSENTKSTLNTMVLGAAPSGSSAPLMQSEYFEAYARVNVPDEEGRAAYVDLYSMPTTEPHRLQISEIRVYANVKGGSQREQS